MSLTDLVNKERKRKATATAEDIDESSDAPPPGSKAPKAGSEVSSTYFDWLPPELICMISDRVCEPHVWKPDTTRLQLKFCADYSCINCGIECRTDKYLGMAPSQAFRTALFRLPDACYDLGFHYNSSPNSTIEACIRCPNAPSRRFLLSLPRMN